MNYIEQIIEYITKFILKTGEQLDIDDRTNLSLPLVDLPIIKKTARTYRKVAIITMSPSLQVDGTQAPDSSLLKWTVGKRANITDKAQAFEWLSKGWIIKELRLKRDGKTLDQVYYRMSYYLHEYLTAQSLNEKDKQSTEFERYQLTARTIVDDLTLKSKNERSVLLSPLLKQISTSINWTIDELKDADMLPKSWSIAKRMKFYEFVLAFTLLSSSQEVFDWKEIGAHFYSSIGGSKAFDQYKEDFIHLLEEWCGHSPTLLGMISLGQITPLYFAGHVRGQWSSYQPGPVHSLTDISIAQDKYITNAHTLWLVENRAILTRLSAENCFIENSNSLVVCVDGHLRSSHKMFIRQLLQTSQLSQVIVWSDYDESGLLIAREMTEVVSGFSLTLKWISHDLRVITTWAEYQKYMTELLQHTQLEQEQSLGGSEYWTSWINH